MGRVRVRHFQGNYLFLSAKSRSAWVQHGPRNLHLARKVLVLAKQEMSHENQVDCICS